MNETAGGYRVGAGRKSQWNSPTKMMRLPAAFEVELTAIAHRLDDGLDAGLDEVDATEKLFTIDELTLAIAAVLVRVPPLNRAAAGKLLKKVATHIRES